MRERKWKQQDPEMVQYYIAPKTYLGEEEAEAEWINENPPAKVFIHTEGYETLTEPHTLYLFGRRGTGKTAMMQMLRHEIRHGSITMYGFAWLIEQDQTIHGLSRQIRMSPFVEMPAPELVEFLVEKWRWILQVSAMEAVCHASAEDGDDDDLKIMRKYVKNETQAQSERIGPLNRFLRLMEDELLEIDYEPLKLGAAISRLGRSLFSVDFAAALECLRNYLRKTKQSVLVLVDSPQQHAHNDAVASAVITALIETALQFYHRRNIDFVYCKVALPSEIYNHLSIQNQEKTDGKNVFLLWTYRDLVTLLAKRYYRLLNPAETDHELEKMDSFDYAKGYLYTYLPDTVVTDSGFQFDTLSYIIRHTTKKPRQAILLFNIILTIAEHEGVDTRELTRKAIVHGVHSRIDILVNGTLDIYEEIFPRAREIIMRLLSRRHSDFSSSDLDTFMREISGIRKSADIGSEQVRRLLLEAGVVGLQQHQHVFPDGDRTLLEALFEYQIKGVLSITNESRCVIHPMFYQDLQTLVDYNSLVYPKPAEDEEKDLLRKQGIVLA